MVVNKLFKAFDHDIKFKDSGITIVIGDNGLGKTVILESIHALFEGKYNYFETLDFEQFKFYFDNGDVWYLTKENKEEVTLNIARDSIKTPLKNIRKVKIHRFNNRHYSKRTRMMEREMEMLRRREMEERRHGHLRSYDMEMEYEYRRMMELKSRLHHDFDEEILPPKWFVEGKSNINVSLIETQRIMTAKEVGSDSYISSVQRCSEQLIKSIVAAVKESSRVSTILDSSYPNRLIKKLRQGSNDSFEELNNALAKLDERRKLLSSTGLTVNINDTDLLQINEKQKDLIKLLKLYIDDSHEKLEPFEDLSEKIALFKSIIDKRFKHKNIEIKQDRGLIFTSTIVKNDDGEFEQIPHSKLSSGEQNELILFYELIFNAHKNDVVLIDEPELSLHISWQNKFIKDLKSINSMNGVTVVIATHSPDIIDENWDLKVELKGLE